jgi:hypothetical protein
MKISKTGISIVALVVAIPSLLVVARAQQTTSNDASWVLPLFTRPIQLEWVARDRVRMTLDGQDNERFTVEATSLTVRTDMDGLHISADGRVALSSKLQPMATAEELDLTVTRDGTLHGTVRR